ncbi:MAG: LapA family protein [Betaproteobacteria bacterium]
MQLRTLFLLLVLIALTIFAMLNWSAFTAPATLSLVFGTVEAPLGVLVLGVIVLLSVAFLAFVVYLQTTVLMDSRRGARELGAQRELADKAEASRFTELQNYIEERLRRQEAQATAQHAEILARMDSGDRDVRQALELSANGLAAHIAELDDRMERVRGTPETNPAPRR